MATLPRIQHVAPVAPVKKSQIVAVVPPREKKPINKTAQQEWQEAMQTRNEALNEVMVQPAVSSRQQQNFGSSEEGTNGNDDPPLASQTDAQAPEESLPLNMNRLGGLIAAFVVHSVVQSSWAVQIPLSHALLQETVLHMRCEQALLTLRFETSDWNARETLMQHMPALLRRLHQSLPQLVNVIWVTD